MTDRERLAGRHAAALLRFGARASAAGVPGRSDIAPGLRHTLDLTGPAPG